MSSPTHESLLATFIRDGVSESIRGTPLENALLYLRYPVPQIHADASIGRVGIGPRILSELKQALDQATFDCPLHGPSMRVVDYFAQTKPLMDVFGHLLKSNLIEPRKRSRFQRMVDGLNSPEVPVRALLTTLQKIDSVLIRHGRCDMRLFYVTPHYGRNAKREFEMRFTLTSAAPRMRSAVLNGTKRQVFQCGQPFGIDGIEWISWKASRLRIAGTNADLPVFVQRHALSELYDRLGLFRDDDGGSFEWYLHDFLWQCLREPEIVRKCCRPGHVLVNYRLNQHRLGYMPAVVVDGRFIVIKTFLFLTMDGTPESRLLKRKLSVFDKYERQDLKLDRLSTFLLTDVRRDRALRRILTECGCGHLFKMAKRLPIAEAGEGQARDIREYLRAFKGITLGDA